MNENEDLNFPSQVSLLSFYLFIRKDRVYTLVVANDLIGLRISSDPSL